MGRATFLQRLQERILLLLPAAGIFGVLGLWLHLSPFWYICLSSSYKDLLPLKLGPILIRKVFISRPQLFTSTKPSISKTPLQPSCPKGPPVLSIPANQDLHFLFVDKTPVGGLLDGEGASAHSWSVGPRISLSWPYRRPPSSLQYLSTPTQARNKPPQQGSGGSWPVLICSSAEAERSMDPTTSGSHTEVPVH